MYKNRHLYGFIALSITLNSWCFAQEVTRTMLLDSLRRQDVRILEHYGMDTLSTIGSRIKLIPEKLLETLMQEDGRKNYRAYMPNEKEIELVAEYFKLLPPFTKKLLQQKLFGIYFVNNYIANGGADFAIDSKNDFYYFLILNTNTLKKSFSDLVTSKDRSNFVDDSTGRTLALNCGDKYFGLLYILLHESAHMVDYEIQVTPYLFKEFKLLKGIDFESTAFTQNFWETLWTPKKEYKYPLWDMKSVYGLGGGAKIKLSQAEEFYDQLSKSPFCTLYASFNWGDDFAELSTFYHLTEKLGQPFEIQVFKNDEVIYRYNPMANKQVTDRIKYLDFLYSHESK